LALADVGRGLPRKFAFFVLPRGSLRWSRSLPQLEGRRSAHKPVLRSHRGESRSSNIRRYDSFERELAERRGNAGAVRTSIYRDRSYASHSQLERLHYLPGKAKLDDDTLCMPALYKLLSLAGVGAHFRRRDFSYFPLFAVF
jgi:hypothetical protein